MYPCTHSVLDVSEKITRSRSGWVRTQRKRVPAAPYLLVSYKLPILDVAKCARIPFPSQLFWFLTFFFRFIGFFYLRYMLCIEIQFLFQSL